MARAPIRTQIGTELLQPQARPVDTYEAPGPSKLRGFAEALSKIDAPLRDFLDARAKKQADEDRIRGEAAFYDDADQDGTLSEAVRSGKVPSQYSPAFVKGFKNAHGNVLGNQIKADFQSAWDAWEGKNDEDPAAYDKFLQEFLRSKLGTDDPEVLRGAMPHIRSIVDSGNSLYTTYRHEQTYNGSLEAGVAGAIQDVNELNAEGLSTEEGTNYPVVFEKIAEKREAFVAKGGRPEDFDKAMVDAMSVKVLSLRDPGLLAWFDQKVPGKDYTYGETPYGSKVKEETVSSLEVIARRNFTEDAQRQKAADEAAKDEAHRQAVEMLSKDPSAPIPPELLEAGAKVDPTFKVRIEEWRKNLGTGFTDPKALREVYSDILSGKGYAAINEAASAGVFGRPEDLTAAYNFAKSFEDSKDRITEVLTSPVADGILKALDVRTKGKDEVSLDPISGMSDEGFEASFDFRRQVQEWVIANPRATAEETDDALSKIGKAVMDRIVLPEGEDEETGAQIYNRPGDMPFTNPFAGDHRKPASAPMQEHRTAPSPPQQSSADEVGGVLKGLSAKRRQEVAERARALGVTPEEFLRRYLAARRARADQN